MVDEQALTPELSSAAIHVKAGGVRHACTPSAEGNGHKDPWSPLPASLASTVSPGSVRPLIPKSKVEGLRKKNIHC